MKTDNIKLSSKSARCNGEKLEKKLLDLPLEIFGSYDLKLKSSYDIPEKTIKLKPTKGCVEKVRIYGKIIPIEINTNSRGKTSIRFSYRRSFFEVYSN